MHRLLDVAERLFAREGIGETSLRALTSEAGVNLAAVNYHFGSKAGLVSAVLGRRIGPMNQERMRRLGELQAAAGAAGPRLHDVVEAFLAPALDLGRGDGLPFFHIVARAHTSPDAELRQLFVAQFDDVAAAFGPAFAGCLAGVPMPEIFWCLHFAIGSMCHSVLNGEMLQEFSKGACRADDPQQVQRLVDFVTGGLLALRLAHGGAP